MNKIINKIKLLSSNLCLGLIILGSSNTSAQSIYAGLVGKAQFQYSARHTSIKSPLKSFLNPERKDFLLSYDFIFELQKSFESIDASTFQSIDTLAALSGADHIQQHDTLGLRWSLSKKMRRMGVSLDLDFELEQAFFDMAYPAQEQALKHWITDRFGAVAPLSFSSNEKIVIQKASDFSMMFSEGLLIYRFSPSARNGIVRVTVSNLAVVKESAHNKLQALTFFRAESTFRNTLDDELNKTLETLRKRPL
jgi:hypothetical protein